MWRERERDMNTYPPAAAPSRRLGRLEPHVGQHRGDLLRGAV